MSKPTGHGRSGAAGPGSLLDVEDSADLERLTQGADRADPSEEHTEFAIGLAPRSDGTTGLRRTPQPPSRLRVETADAPPTTAPRPRPPLDLSEGPEGLLQAPMRSSSAAKPLDPAKFATAAADEVASLINEVIDEVDAAEAARPDTPAEAQPAPSNGPSTAQGPISAPMVKTDDLVLDAPRRSRPPARLDEGSAVGLSNSKRFLVATAGESRTDVVDSAAAAMDRVVFRSLQTGARPPVGPPPRPDSILHEDGAEVPVVMGRAPTDDGSGLELADPVVPRGPTYPRPRVDVLDEVAPEIGWTTRVLAVLAAIVVGLTLLSILRSCGN